jgi:hypothetical protein
MDVVVVNSKKIMVAEMYECLICGKEYIDDGTMIEYMKNIIS